MSMRYINNFSKPSFVFDDEFTGYLRFDINSNCVYLFTVNYIGKFKGNFYRGIGRDDM